MRRLIIADHPGVPKFAEQALEGAGEIEALNLPFWEDSCLSRAIRLHRLTALQQSAAMAHGDRLMRLLRDALSACGTADDQWLYLGQVLQTHAVTPLAEAIALAGAAAERFAPDEVVALADVGSRDFWSGQSVAEHAAAAAARSLGVRWRTVATVRGRPGALAAAAHSTSGALRWPAIAAHSWALLRRAVAIAKAAGPPKLSSADVLMLAGGPVTEALARKLAARLTERGLRSCLLTDPLLSGGRVREGFIAMGAAAARRGRAPRLPGILSARRRAGAVAAGLRGRLDAVELRALWPRLLSLEARDRPLLSWLAADAELVLDTVQPRAAVAFHFYPRRATPYLTAARRRGLPTICCQHGLIAPLDYPVACYERVLVFNRYTAELVGAAASPGMGIAVVGNPSLDALITSPPEPHHLAGAQGRPVAVVATQPNDQPGVGRRQGWWFHHVAGAAARCGVYLAVKLHPDQPAERYAAMYRDALAAAGAAGEVIPHGTVALPALIAGADAFVTQFSSSILEAMVLGRPAIFVEMRDGPPFYPFDDFGAAVRVTRPDEMEPALRRAVERRRAQPPPQFVDKHLAPLDGRALERMAEAIAAACTSEQ